VAEAALVEPLRRWDPEQIGGFMLLGRLGAGAMGQVYLGRSAAGRLVAVKTIKAELAEEPDYRTRFGQEVAAARRVSGAFTAAVVAADSEADVPWLATVYVPAPALSQLVRSCGPIPPPAVRWLAAGCAEALESIHGVGLVHRDLKPSNVLVSPDGPRVIDFGVARAAERVQLTVTRGSVGTPAYMAPEQARDTRQATSASDIYALGAIMLFAATGHPPYQGETVMDVLVRLATGPPDLSGLPAELSEVVTACLERDPRNRPTAGSLLARVAPDLAASGELGAAPLPPTALALIEEYRTLTPTSASRVAADGAASGDATIGSQAGIAGAAGSRGGGTSGRGRTGSRSAWAGRLPRIAGVAAATVALLAASWLAGRFTAGAGPTSGHPVAGRTSPSVAGSMSPSATGSTSPSSGGCDGGLGPVIGPPPQGGSPPPGGGSPPPGGGSPPPGGSCVTLADLPSSSPAIGVSQPTGDADTVFIVRGQSWPAGSLLTITLVGIGTSRYHPIVDQDGTFNYALNQDHDFYAGSIPPGTYTVRATDSSGVSAQARFRVGQ
jgi:Protein kinase domain